MKIIKTAAVLFFFAVGIANAADSSNEKISKELANPVAHLISVPFQFNYDYGGGVNDTGKNYYLKIQPVIPFDLNENWKVISRSILPISSESDFGTSSKTGLGDLNQTFFFTPNSGPGLIWGAGPVISVPTATEPELGSEKWSAGPSFVVVKETKDWTLGVLANHLWSFAGDSDRGYVSQTFVQPFITRHLPDAWSLNLTSEYTYDWHYNEETLPLNLTVAKVVKIGPMPVSFSVGGRYYVDKPDGGPDWGLRAMVTLVFPK